MRPLARLFHKDALRDNIRAVRRRASAPHILAVVKSRAYGHGLLFVANAIKDLADGFAVAESEDAEALRNAGVNTRILLLSGPFDENDVRRIVQCNLWTAVCDKQQLQRIVAAPANAKLRALIKVDSGMHRLGFAPDDAAAAMNALSAAASVSEVGLMSHFARADEEGGIKESLKTLTPLRQKASFVSLGNSAASLLQGDIGDDWARIGIALYGSSPAPSRISRDELGLSAAMTLKTLLLQTRTIRKGESAGYGGEWRAPKDMRIGIAACGYADGYPRAANMIAKINGKPAPVAGRVSMEMTALDLSACEDARAGDETIMWGETPSIDEVAAAAERISYELFVAAGTNETESANDDSHLQQKEES